MPEFSLAALRGLPPELADMPLTGLDKAVQAAGRINTRTFEQAVTPDPSDIGSRKKRIVWPRNRP